MMNSKHYQIAKLLLLWYKKKQETKYGEKWEKSVYITKKRNEITFRKIVIEFRKYSTINLSKKIHKPLKRKFFSNNVLASWCLAAL